MQEYIIKTMNELRCRKIIDFYFIEIDRRGTDIIVQLNINGSVSMHHILIEWFVEDEYIIKTIIYKAIKYIYDTHILDITNYLYK